MTDGAPLPAEFALSGQLDLLVDRDDLVFTGLGYTIGLRIEVPDILSSLSHHSSDFVFTVAGVRWMGSTSEYRISSSTYYLNYSPVKNRYLERRTEESHPREVGDGYC